MRQDKPLHLPSENALQQFTESLLVIVHARAKVTDNLSAPSFRSAVGFQHLKLAGEGIFLVPTTDTGITNRQRVEGFQSHHIGGGIIAGPALRLACREQLASFFPPTHRFTGSAENRRCLRLKSPVYRRLQAIPILTNLFCIDRYYTTFL